MRRFLFLFLATVACSEPTPWITEEACQDTASAYCTKRADCGGREPTELCYQRIHRDCVLGLEGPQPAELPEACLEAIESQECIHAERLPEACVSWYCQEGAGQGWCP
jgi:hypothetical protein